MNRRIPVLAALLLAAAGCSTVDPATRLTRELLAMPKEEAYSRGDALVSRKKYETGRQYLRFVAENYANDPIGKQAALRLADSYFDEKTPLGFLEAQARYRDFRNRYPSHPRADYALFRLALCSDRQAERPDRDQTNTRLAANSYRELLQLFPDSPYAAEARLRHAAMRDLLAEHEFRVAHFYVKRKAWQAAKLRFDVILGVFTEYRRMDQTLYEAGLAERWLGHDEDARLLWEKLAQDYPKSEFARKLPASARSVPASAAAPAASAEAPEPPAAAAPVAVEPAVPAPAAVTVRAPDESPPPAAAPPAPAPRAAPPAAAVTAQHAAPPPSASRSRAPLLTAPGIEGTVFSVQLASYQDRAAAEKHASLLSSRHSQPAHVVRVEIPAKGTWYRVLLGSFASEREAQEFRTRAGADGSGVLYRLSSGD